MLFLGMKKKIYPFWIFAVLLKALQAVSEAKGMAAASWTKIRDSDNLHKNTMQCRFPSPILQLSLESFYLIIMLQWNAPNINYQHSWTENMWGSMLQRELVHVQYEKVTQASEPAVLPPELHIHYTFPGLPLDVTPQTLGPLHENASRCSPQPWLPHSRRGPIPVARVAQTKTAHTLPSSAPQRNNQAKNHIKIVKKQTNINHSRIHKKQASKLPPNT
jgi:hypothetical protein